jgi:hypothetical protein
MTGFPLEQVTNGAELRLGAGTFQVTAPLVIDKDIVLTGAGQNSTTIRNTFRDLIISVTEAEVTITDLTTDGGVGCLCFVALWQVEGVNKTPSFQLVNGLAVQSQKIQY